MKIHKNAIISGSVQGVGFRAGVKRLANRLGLTGWVKNNSDGSVQLSVEGENDKVDILIDWCKTGPILSRVKHVEVFEDELEDDLSLVKFEIV